jgi:hypothetical protein
MKTTYWVLSVDGKLVPNASGLPVIYYSNDPKVVPTGGPEKLANADAVFIPVEVELPDPEDLTRRHFDEKNKIIGALREGGPKPRFTWVTLSFLKGQDSPCTADFISSRTAVKKEDVISSLEALLVSHPEVRAEKKKNGAMFYWYETPKTAPGISPEKIVLDYLQKTRGDEGGCWQSVDGIAAATKLARDVVEGVVVRQNMTGAVIRQSHISGYLYRASAPKFELTPTVARTSPLRVAVLKALKGNKYKTGSEISRELGRDVMDIAGVLADLLYEGEVVQRTLNRGLVWKKPLAKKPCRAKAQSWRSNVIAALDASKRPMTEAELEQRVKTMFPEQCGDKSVHGAVGSAVHALKYTKKHKRFRFEKRGSKIVMWTVQDLPMPTPMNRG